MRDYLDVLLVSLRFGVEIALVLAVVIAMLYAACSSIKFAFDQADRRWDLLRVLWTLVGYALIVFYLSAAVGSIAYCNGARVPRQPAEAHPGNGMSPR